jgi:O-antigen ligase/tetratricopeptide (TPR) repeat protein
MNRPSALWIAFLAVWATSLVWIGGVSEAGLPVIAAAVALLYGVSLVLLKEPARLSRGAVVFLLALSGLFLVQLLPLPFLFPRNAALRATHGVGQLWPATADAFYTVRTLAQVATYVMSGLLVLRLRQAGLSTSQVITGIFGVLVLEASYGLVQVFADLKNVPLYGPRASPDSASGTLVSRNNFGGLMAISLVLALVRAYGRIAWPARAGGTESGKPRWMRRLEGGTGWALAAALFAVALVLSKSRGATLAAGGGLALLPFLYRGRASVAGAVALLAMGAAAVFVANPAGLVQRFGQLDPFDLSAEDRWTIFTTTAQAAMNQPILGFGWGTHPRAYHPYQPASMPGQIHHAHSEYVNVFFEAGLLGLLILLVGTGLWFVRVWRASKPLPGPDRMPVTAALAAISVLALHSIVDFDLRITSIGMLSAALLGLGAAAVRDGSARPTWPLPALGLLAAAALMFLHLNPKRVEGEAAARRALGLSPYDQETAWELARVTGDLARLETAADLWPAHPDIQREAGLTFWERSDKARAAKCLRRTFAQEPLMVAAVMDEIWSAGRPLSDYEELLPERAGARAVYAASLVRRRLWKEAQEAFDRGVIVDAANARWFDYYASALESAGQWGMEATVRDRRLAVKSDAWAHAASAQAWLKLGAFDQAMERATTASRVDPSNAQWAALRGSIFDAKGDRIRAVEAYTVACGLAPSELQWRLRRGLVELADKTFESAAADLQEVLRSRPKDRQAALGLARALAGQGQTASARILLDDWLGKEPGDAEAAALRDALPR